MKIDGQEYNFNIRNLEVNSDEILLNNDELISIFNLYDTNQDKKLSQNELNNIFDKFLKMDNDSTKGTLSDSEIGSVVQTYKQNIPNITINDLKMFIKELATTITAKKIAAQLHEQISGWSSSDNTINMLKKIDRTNAAEVINAYKKIAKNTLAKDIDDEWILDVDTVKTYICKPLVAQAKTFEIKFNEKQYTKINDIETLNSYISNLTELVINAKKQNQEKTYFSKKTKNLINKKISHKTQLLNIAQDNLGIIEITADEYNSMSGSEKEKTHMKIVDKYNGSPDDAWCAYAVSYLAEKAGMNIGGEKASVYKSKSNSWVSWAKKNNTWNNIPTKEMTQQNYLNERKNREQYIKKQLDKMHEGDFIVFASQYIVTAEGGNDYFKSVQASHIGIIEKIDVKNGTVMVIEGNANISKKGQNTDFILVTEKSGDPIGNQEYGEFREENLRDGLIRKIYTISDLVKHGYSGFIDNSRIVK